MVGSITNVLSQLYVRGGRVAAALTTPQPSAIMKPGVGVRRNRPSGKMTPTEDFLEAVSRTARTRGPVNGHGDGWTSHGTAAA